MTSATPWIARVDLDGLVGYAGVPFLLHCSACVLLKLQSSVEEDILPEVKKGQRMGQK